MQVILILGFVVLLALLTFGAAGCSRKPADSQNSRNPVTVHSIHAMSKGEIEKMLRRLETQKAPKPKMGAMCYDVAAPPSRAEYVCPRCGEKTLYTSGDTEFIARELEACRREFDMLKKETKLPISLDESSYCGHCSPNARQHQLIFSITYDNGRTHTDSPITCQDIQMLKAFLQERLSYPTSYGEYRPLKEQLPRLMELLGVQPDAGKEGR